MICSWSFINRAFARNLSPLIMSHQSPPNQSLEFLPTRQRVYMACTHCRKRKVRCITDEESSDKPSPRRDPPAPSYTSNPSNQPTTHGYDASNPRPAHGSRQHSRSYSLNPPSAPPPDHLTLLPPSAQYTDPGGQPQYHHARQQPDYGYAHMQTAQASNYPPPAPPYSTPRPPPQQAGYGVEYTSCFYDPSFNNAYQPNVYPGYPSPFTKPASELTSPQTLYLSTGTMLLRRHPLNGQWQDKA
ncbi:hypothetical protein B0H11DRAFT_2378472 [Mycena galericulata]|nr:hypothetical protein B0H11DRAFT_2378472 [Mycena galericulata]